MRRHRRRTCSCIKRPLPSGRASRRRTRRRVRQRPCRRANTRCPKEPFLHDSVELMAEDGGRRKKMMAFEVGLEICPANAAARDLHDEIGFRFGQVLHFQVSNAGIDKCFHTSPFISLSMAIAVCSSVTRSLMYFARAAATIPSCLPGPPARQIDRLRPDNLLISNARSS